MPAPVDVDLAHAAMHSRCILWCADVSLALKDDTLGVQDRLWWSARVLDVDAAQRVLPLDIRPDSNYFEAWRDSRHKDDHTTMRANAYRAIVGGDEHYSQIFRCYDRYGVEHWLAEDAHVQRREEGRWHIVGAALDVTASMQSLALLDRLQLELTRTVRERDQSGAVVDMLLQSVSLGVALLDSQLRFIRVNQPFSTMIGISEQTILGCKPTQWIDRRFAALLAEMHRDAVGPDPVVRELALETVDGPRHWKLTFRPLSLTGCVVLAYGLTVADITDQLRTQELRIAKEAAETSNRAKDRFLAQLSHELRTPLTPVLTIVSSLEHNPAIPREVRDELAIARNHVEMETRLIDDLLDVSRALSGRLRLNMEHVNVHDLLAIAERTCQDHLTDKRMRVERVFSATGSHVRGDPARLRQVFVNIIRNASQHVAPGGRLSILTENDPPGRIAIRFVDDGAGIPASHLDKIFDLFEQAPASAHRVIKGLGLGLTISRSIIEQHGGAIQAFSAGPGKGSTFQVQLDLSSPPAATLPTPDMPRPAAEAPHPALSLKILMVEDHLPTLRLFARLTQALGHQTCQATSVSEAVAAASSEQFDLLISDLGLPDGSGLDVMRAVSTRQTIRGIAITGYGRDDDIAACRQAGFAAHLTKPITAQQLTAAIRQVMSEPPAQ